MTSYEIEQQLFELCFDERTDAVKTKEEIIERLEESGYSTKQSKKIFEWAVRDGILLCSDEEEEEYTLNFVVR